MESWGIGIMADFAKAAFPAFAAASAELAGYDGRKKFWFVPLPPCAITPSILYRPPIQMICVTP